MKSWTVSAHARLLTFLREKLHEDCKTIDIRWSIEHNRCFINNSVERFCSSTLNKGDHVTLDFCNKPQIMFEPSRILYEDEWILAYFKPPYISSPELSTMIKLNAVHRLDRDTTGVLLFAKNAEAQRAMETLFRKREIQKEYLAIVTPPPLEKKGVITLSMRPQKKRDGAILWEVGNGSFAKTSWKVVSKNKTHALLRCTPHTGRTHQIRVHLKAIGHPILGDFEYGPKTQKGSFRPLLHAEQIRFIHPFQKREVNIFAPIPSDFKDLISTLFPIS